MKKLNIILSIMAASLLLITVSCKKQDVTTPNPYVKALSQDFVDTPYRSNNPAAGTPYKRSAITPVNNANMQLSIQFADTPYLGSNHFEDTPYLKRTTAVNNFK
ncbi:MAG: hypothetical protein ABI685_06315 [Ferruginibacter sp.]